VNSTLRNTVAFRILIPLIIGIILSKHIRIPIWITVSFIISLAVIIRYVKFRYKFRWFSGGAVLLAMAGVGLLVSSLHYTDDLENKSNQLNVKYSFGVELLTDPIPTPNSTKVIARIIDHPIDSLMGGKMMIYGIDKDYSSGSQIAISGYVNPISGPKNPSEFDYRAFMAKQGIYYSSFVNESNWVVTSTLKKGRSSLLDKLNTHCISYLETQLEGEELAIGKALLLGNRDDLSSATKDTFTRSGTMHILAVSGLHVGILFLLVNSLFQFLQRRLSFPQFLTPFFILAVIWVFAFLTGGKASVIRAAFMFSLFSIGLHFFRNTHSFNILSATAVVMLLIKPTYLMDVGFQLSFSAVAGILLIFPILRTAWPGGPRVWRYFKEITFLSFAAQLSTMPLSIYYFDQMPTLGLLTNLVAIPISFVIVSSGFMGFILGGIPIIGDALGYILSTSISLIASINSWVSNLSFSTISGIHWTASQAMIFSITVLLFIGWWKLRWRKAFVSGLAMLGLFLTSKTVHLTNQLQQQEVVVYDVKGGMAVEVVKGKSSVLFVSGSINDAQIKYSIKPYQTEIGIRNKEIVHIDSTSLFVNDMVQYSYPFLMIQDQLLQIGEKSTSHLSDYHITDNPSNSWFRNQRAIPGKRIITNKYPSKYLELDDSMYFTKVEGALRLKIEKTLISSVNNNH